MSVTLPMTRTLAAKAGWMQMVATKTASAAIKICFLMTRSFRANKNKMTLRMSRCADRVRQRVLASGRLEGAQAQHATVANAARFALSSVTRPGQLQGRAQLQA